MTDRAKAVAALPGPRVAAAELTTTRTRLLRAQVKAGSTKAEALRAERDAFRAESELAAAERDASLLLAKVLSNPDPEMPSAFVYEVMAALPGPEREAFGELYDDMCRLIGQREGV